MTYIWICSVTNGETKSLDGTGNKIPIKNVTHKNLNLSVTSYCEVKVHQIKLHSHRKNKKRVEVNEWFKFMRASNLITLNPILLPLYLDCIILYTPAPSSLPRAIKVICISYTHICQRFKVVNFPSAPEIQIKTWKITKVRDCSVWLCGDVKFMCISNRNILLNLPGSSKFIETLYFSMMQFSCLAGLIFFSLVDVLFLQSLSQKGTLMFNC